LLSVLRLSAELGMEPAAFLSQAGFGTEIEAVCWLPWRWQHWSVALL